MNKGLRFWHGALLTELTVSTKAVGTAPIIGAATWAVRVRQSLNMVAGPFTVGSLPFVTTLVQSQIVNESLPIHYVL